MHLSSILSFMSNTVNTYVHVICFNKFAKISNKLLSRSGGSCVLKLRRQTNCIGLGIPDDYYYLLNHFKMAFWLLLVRKRHAYSKII